MHTFIVVVFNRRLSEVVTLDTLNKIIFPKNSAATIFIWDNSPASFLQESPDVLNVFSKKFEKINYHRSSVNSSLSVLYNKVLDQVFSAGSGSATIFDHDSEIATDFFVKIKAALTGKLLIVPRVVSNRTGLVISPRYQASHYFSIRPPVHEGVSLTASGENISCDFFAVGSGMTITRKLWESGLRFDEALSFYGVDTEFCRDYSSRHQSFVIADTGLLHDVSSEGEDSFESLKWRFNSHMDYWAYQLKKHSRMPNFTVGPYVMLWRLLVKVKWALRSLLAR